MKTGLTRAERYKRNYRLISNKWKNPTLAKRAQSWSDERISKELGIEVKGKRTPKLQTYTKRQARNADKKLVKFIYATSQGITSKEANKLRYYDSYKEIDIETKRVKTQDKRYTAKNKRDRMDLWSEWSKKVDGFPPIIKREAQKINRNQTVAGKPLDSDAHYGYVYQFYLFVENMTPDEIDDLIKQDPHDSYRVIYKTTVSV